MKKTGAVACLISRLSWKVGPGVVVRMSCWLLSVAVRQTLGRTSRLNNI